MLKLLYLPISRFCTMEIFIFAVHNGNKIYILHGAQYWKLDLWKISDFAWCKVILIFDLCNEDKFYIIHGTSYRNFDNWELTDYGSCKIIKFWYLPFITKKIGYFTLRTTLRPWYLSLSSSCMMQNVEILIWKFLHSLKRASETFEYEEKSFQTMR